MRPSPKPELAGVRVVAAYPGGSPTFPSSRDRVAGYTQELRDKYGVEIVGSIDELLLATLTSCCWRASTAGRTWSKRDPSFQAHKPVFIDKPVAGSLADAIAIFELARETGTPCFSSSSLRFSPGIAGMRHNAKVGDVLGCDAYGPCATRRAPPRPLLVRRPRRRGTVHDHGHGLRAGVSHADRGDRSWSLGSGREAESGRSAVFGRVITITARRSSERRELPRGGYGGYEPLVVEIVKFFKTGKPPVSAEETLEIFAFMEAADESKRQGGKPVDDRERHGQGKGRCAVK